MLIACFLAVAVGGCDDEERGPAGGRSSAATPTASAATDDVALLLEAGATEEEAACLADVLAERTRTNSDTVDGTMEAVATAAEECADEARRDELTAAIRQQLAEELEKVVGPLRDHLAAQFEAGGATSEEAQCIADRILEVDPEDVDLYGTPARKTRIAIALFRDHAGACASSARLAELARAWVLGPQVEALEAAGATPREVECFVTKVGELDLFLPSSDFNGPTAAGMGGTRIAEEMDGCIPEPRVREIVTRIFEDYQRGCTKTSEDPLAPYEC